MKFDALANLKRFYCLIGETSPSNFVVNPAYSYVKSPTSFWPNALVDLNISSSELNQTILEIKSAGIPSKLICCESDIHPEVLEKLNQNQAIKRFWTSMTYDLDKPINIKELKHFELKQIHTKSEIEDWSKVIEISLMQGNEIDKNIFYELIQNELIDFFIGLENGKPVAGSILFTDNDLAGIYCVGVLPEYQGKGYGKAVTKIAMQKGLENGCKQAILQATQAGQVIYEQIGFKNRGIINLFNLELY